MIGQFCPISNLAKSLFVKVKKGSNHLYMRFMDRSLANVSTIRLESGTQFQRLLSTKLTANELSLSRIEMKVCNHKRADLCDLLIHQDGLEKMRVK